MELLAFVAPLVLLCSFISPVHSLYEFATWTYLTFENITSSNYIPDYVIFTGIQATSSRCFLSIPRLFPGVPVTLATIPSTGGPYKNKDLKPFPNLEYQLGFADQCQSLVSVHRSRLDSCGLLWVLDTGSINALDYFSQICPPKLVVFDASTGVEVFRIVIPENVLRQDSLLVSMAMDRRGTTKLLTCPQAEELVIYISDVTGGIIVYDHSTRTFWRQEHPTFKPDPKFASITMNGEYFYQEEGILGMHVGLLRMQTKVLYYQPFSSKNIYAVRTDSLLIKDNANLAVETIYEKSSQGAGLTVDAFGRVVFSPVKENSIQVLNTVTNRTLLLAQDDEKLQFVADFSYDSADTLWMISNKYQSFINRYYSKDGINLRILRIPFSQQFRVV
ncbi:major royal jelly protein 1-like [Neocloeon triangulifer]|uniref:major royal jelly protein 1-like n=1 Tax=Neocloeon triangulifer TaxID=2078957 RepID=UPI00286EDA9C|nr:major royal jelly protein 1-like [Neocloeon triangulifer]